MAPAAIHGDDRLLALGGIDAPQLAGDCDGVERVIA